MKFYVIIIFLSFLGYDASAQHKKKKKIEKIFQKEIKKKNIHNAFLKVYSPSKSIDWYWTDGLTKNGNKTILSTPFYTASIGKTFTACAIVILQEKGVLNFDDPIGKYLSKEVMDQLHVYREKDYSDSITIEHLLNHTSGLPDYFENSTIDGSPNVLELVVSDTNKIWSPTELIMFSKNKMQSLHPPGKGFNYTDTEYILLGLIIESVSKVSLDTFFQENIFNPLSLNTTYLNMKSANKNYKNSMAEMYLGDLKVSSFKSLSADWAGGGIISTMDDLTTFNEALVNGKIISKDSYFVMQNWVKETKGMYYGYGLRKIILKELFPLLPPLTIIGHNGSNGSFMFYSPELDLYIVGTVNQLDEYKNSIVLVVKVLNILNKNINYQTKTYSLNE